MMKKATSTLRQDPLKFPKEKLKQCLWLLFIISLTWSPAYSQISTSDNPDDQEEPRALGRVKIETLVSEKKQYYDNLYVITIGINDYQHPAIPDLRFAEKDALAFAQMMASRYGAITTTLIGKDATRQNITATIMGIEATKTDAVILFFAGHGQSTSVRDGKIGFLIPQDANVDPSETSASKYYPTCIPMDQVLNWRDASNAHHYAIIVDACFSGFFTSTRELPMSRPIQEALRYPVYQIFTAGTSGETATESPKTGHGAFTNCLLTGLGSGSADMNSDGFIRGQELAAYIRNSNLGNQTPQFRTINGDGDFVLVRTDEGAIHTTPPTLGNDSSKEKTHPPTPIEKPTPIEEKKDFLAVFYLGDFSTDGLPESVSEKELTRAIDDFARQSKKLFPDDSFLVTKNHLSTPASYYSDKTQTLFLVTPYISGTYVVVDLQLLGEQTDREKSTEIEKPFVWGDGVNPSLSTQLTQLLKGVANQWNVSKQD